MVAVAGEMGVEIDRRLIGRRGLIVGGLGVGGLGVGGLGHTQFLASSQNSNPHIFIWTQGSEDLTWASGLCCRLYTSCCLGLFWDLRNSGVPVNYCVGAKGKRHNGQKWKRAIIAEWRHWQINI
jgi:hypothetical protein